MWNLLNEGQGYSVLSPPVHQTKRYCGHWAVRVAIVYGRWVGHQPFRIMGKLLSKKAARQPVSTPSAVSLSRGVDNDEFGYNPRKKYAASARKNVPPVRKHLPTPKLHVEQVQPPTRDEAYFAGLKQNKMLNTQRERVVREARLEQMGNEERQLFLDNEVKAAKQQKDQQKHLKLLAKASKKKGKNVVGGGRRGPKGAMARSPHAVLKTKEVTAAPAMVTHASLNTLNGEGRLGETAEKASSKSPAEPVLPSPPSLEPPTLAPSSEPPKAAPPSSFVQTGKPGGSDDNSADARAKKEEAFFKEMKQKKIDEMAREQEKREQMLAAMTEEEITAFLENEKAIEEQERLQQRMLKRQLKAYGTGGKKKKLVGGRGKRKGGRMAAVQKLIDADEDG